MTSQQFIQQRLQARHETGAYRQLQVENNLVDFCSNDYLGFARSEHLTKAIHAEIEQHTLVLNGSTGSRLLSGNTSYAEQLEEHIAAFHSAEAGLLFNSGYDANLGLLSSVPQRGDTVIHDELIHASIIDGIRLSNAKRYSFKHNDLNSLERKLKHTQGICYVVIESVYSMDGDLAPLLEMALLVQKYNANLIVDEAHAFGVFGRGLINRLRLEDKVFARVITFGKALGCHGAIVLGSQVLRQYLINFARPFIYTTAAPLHQLAAIKTAYQLMDKSEDLIYNLQSKIRLYKNLMETYFQDTDVSAIQTLVIGGNDSTKRLAKQIQEGGFDVRAILNPTVAEGQERLRICLHIYNSDDEITNLTNLIKLNING